MADSPSWSEEIRALYLSGASNQFILHGNVGDRILVPGGPAGEGQGASDAGSDQLGSLVDYLVQRQLQRFDVVLAYELGGGLQVLAGEKVFSQWPTARLSDRLPHRPAEAVGFIDHFLRFCVNSRELGDLVDEGAEGSVAKAGAARVGEIVEDASAYPKSLIGRNLSVGVIFNRAQLVLPALRQGHSYELSSMASVVRSWSSESHFLSQHLAVFLLADSLNDLHPLLSFNPRSASLEVPLPTAADLPASLRYLEHSHPGALEAFSGEWEKPASRLAGATLASIESLVKRRAYERDPLEDRDLGELKKALVEKDCGGLIEFVEPTRTLDDYYGQEPVKQWLRQDIELWGQGDLQAMPMGYLLCGPVGTGKTYLVECLAGEAGVPVVKMKNFRDRWVGSTEANLEKIFGLLQALGRCFVFVDEADQALGSRDSGSGDSGVSGRVYSMMAKEMSRAENRGRVLWILASSRPDLIEVDLKRPGRIDVKIPIFPTTSGREAYQLIRALCLKHDLELPEDLPDDLAALMPSQMTPGSAESLAIKVYRLVKTRKVDAVEALRDCLDQYQSPVPPEIMDYQIGLAVREASDLDFVPESFRTGNPLGGGV